MINHVGGLNQLTRNLTAKWASDKIRVNCVALGVIMIDMAKEVLRTSQKDYHSCLLRSQSVSTLTNYMSDAK
jgi:NAD(P)-dependent dehydrogenase (short-subunit alcohol dehydrogenase family)